MKERIQNLIKAIDEVISFDKPDVNDEMLYTVVFQTHSEVIIHMIKALGLTFDWYDPDTSYREDVDAYLGALKNFKKDLETLIG